MSDWDSSTTIGFRTRGGSSAPRQSTIRGASALNAAQRSGGVVSTDKKYGTSNTSNDPSGQRLTKVANSDDIVKLQRVDDEVRKVMAQARLDLKLNQGDLAKKVNLTGPEIGRIERGDKVPTQQEWSRLEKALGIKLRGSDIGSPLRKLTKREQALLKEQEDADRAARKLEKLRLKEEAEAEEKAKSLREEEEAKKLAEEEAAAEAAKLKEEAEKAEREKEAEDNTEKEDDDSETKSPVGKTAADDDDEEEEVVVSKRRKGKGLDDDDE